MMVLLLGNTFMKTNLKNTIILGFFTFLNLALSHPGSDELAQYLKGWQAGGVETKDVKDVFGDTIQYQKWIRCNPGSSGQLCEKTFIVEKNEPVLAPNVEHKSIDYQVTRVQTRYESKTVLATKRDYRDQLKTNTTFNVQVGDLNKPRYSDEINLPYRLEMNVQPQFIHEFNTVAPAIVVGMFNSYQSYQATKQTSEALMAAYKADINRNHQLLSLIDQSNSNLEKDLSKQFKSSQALMNIWTASLPIIPKSQVATDEGLQFEQDPFAFKSYHSFGTSLSHKAEDLNHAIEDKDFYKASELIENLQYLSSQEEQDQAIIILKNKVNANGTLRIKAIDSTLKQGPLENRNFSTHKFSAPGQSIRRLANTYQSFWGFSRGLERSSAEVKALFVIGLGQLTQADLSFGENSDQQGITSLVSSQVIIDFLRGVGDGSVESLVGAVKGLPILANSALSTVKFFLMADRDPEKAMKQLYSFIIKTPEVASALVSYFSDKGRLLLSGSSYERGSIIGEITGDIISAVITDGTISTIKGFSRGARIAETMSESGQALAGLLNNEGRSALRVRGRLVNEIEPFLLSPKAAQAIRPMLETDPGLVQNLIQVNIELKTGLLSATKNSGVDEYLANQIVNKNKILGTSNTFTNEGLLRIGRKYEDLAIKMESVSPIQINETVWRAVPEKIHLTDGTLIENTESTVFKFHDGMKYQNGRYSAPGESALYTSLGQKPENAWNTVMEELEYHMGKDSYQPLILESKIEKLDKVLDLTDAATREKLGISIKELRNNETLNKYEITHQIGDLAKKKGFDGIKAPSAPDKTGINLIIFGD